MAYLAVGTFWCFFLFFGAIAGFVWSRKFYTSGVEPTVSKRMFKTSAVKALWSGNWLILLYSGDHVKKEGEIEDLFAVRSDF